MRVVRGAVMDVAVDIRKDSPTYGRHYAATLTGENKKQFLIPRGFAHGFIVLEDDTVFSYKCDNVYNKAAEKGMRFDDPALGIEWPETGTQLILSEKDRALPMFKDVVPETLFSGAPYTERKGKTGKLQSGPGNDGKGWNVI